MKAYGDIWRIDMVDTYADLALKTLKMFSILPARVDADFYFKVDDDVAMNVGAMAEYLTAKRSQGNLYLVRVLPGQNTWNLPFFHPSPAKSAPPPPLPLGCWGKGGGADMDTTGLHVG